MSKKDADLNTLLPGSEGSTARLAVLSTLARWPNGRSVRQLTELTQLPENHISTAVVALSKASRIEAVRRGPEAPWRIPLAIQRHMGRRVGVPPLQDPDTQAPAQDPAQTAPHDSAQPA